MKNNTAKNVYVSATTVKGVRRESDVNLGWVARMYPQLELWRQPAVDWLKGETLGVPRRLGALVSFFENYLVRQELPLDPNVFLDRGTVLPDFYKTACPDSSQGVKYNNLIHAFLMFVLLRDFSEVDAFDRPTVLPTHHNPVTPRSKAGLAKLDESVHSPLPYGYIDELRKILAAGPHFRDWVWAQSALGAGVAKPGHCAPDWFEVSEEQLDKNDADCVWRLRSRSRALGPVLEVWSPARWVVLLVKLILPLRTGQVRTLDSGEADTWQYDSSAAGSWRLNTSALAQGTERQPLQQGVFRRHNSISADKAPTTVLYINTNKTADAHRSGSDKGYVMPWMLSSPVHQDVFYWLEKMRNWQSRYNPLRHRASWAQLDSRHHEAKSRVQLAGYPDACFCFRSPESDAHERHFPVTKECVERSWFELLNALEDRLAARGETQHKGARIRLLPPPENRVRNGRTTLYPLHSLRVSLISALALEGQVPFPILQKLVGHSRLLMTLYYFKPGASQYREILTEAVHRLETKKETTIVNFLLNTEHDQLLEQAITNASSSLAAAIPEHPASRNPAGWMPLHHGLCLVGGNTSEVEDNRTISGCYNGGPLLAKGSASAQPRHGPVPGGVRNCVRCRWFVTEAHHLPALGAHFKNLAYHFDEARNACIEREARLQDLKRQKASEEEAGRPFTEHAEYRQTDRGWETAMKRFSDLAEDLVACWRLIERCKAALEVKGNGTQLVAAGSAVDVKIVFEEIESELLQISDVCRDVEVYPDLSPGKAVLRRSQILDAVFHREGLPPSFMLLSEREQLHLGNEFMRRLARQVNSANPALGERQVVDLIDSGRSLSQYLGIKLDELLPRYERPQSFRLSSGKRTMNDE